MKRNFLSAQKAKRTSLSSYQSRPLKSRELSPISLNCGFRTNGCSDLSLQLKNLDKWLDKEEISMENYSLNSGADPLQEFELYKDYLQGLICSLSNSQISEYVTRAMKGLEKSFTKLFSHSRGVSYTNFSPACYSKGTQTPADCSLKHLEVNLSQFKSLRSTLKRLNFKNVFGQLKVLHDNLSRLNAKTPSMGNIYISVQHNIASLTKELEASFNPDEEHTVKTATKGLQVNIENTSDDPEVYLEILKSKDKEISELKAQVSQRKVHQIIPTNKKDIDNLYLKHTEERCRALDGQVFALNKELRIMEKKEKMLERTRTVVEIDTADREKLKLYNEVLKTLTAKNEDKMKELQGAFDEILDLKTKVFEQETKASEIEQAWKRQTGFDFYYTKVQTKLFVKELQEQKNQKLKQYQDEIKGNLVNSIVRNVKQKSVRSSFSSDYSDINDRDDIDDIIQDEHNNENKKTSTKHKHKKQDKKQKVTFQNEHSDESSDASESSSHEYHHDNKNEKKRRSQQIRNSNLSKETPKQPQKKKKLMNKINKKALLGPKHRSSLVQGIKQNLTPSNRSVPKENSSPEDQEKLRLFRLTPDIENHQSLSRISEDEEITSRSLNEDISDFAIRDGFSPEEKSIQIDSEGDLDHMNFQSDDESSYRNQSIDNRQHSSRTSLSIGVPTRKKLKKYKDTQDSFTLMKKEATNYSTRPQKSQAVASNMKDLAESKLFSSKNTQAELINLMQETKLTNGVSILNTLQQENIMFSTAKEQIDRYTQTKNQNGFFARRSVSIVSNGPQNKDECKISNLKKYPELFTSIFSNFHDIERLTPYYRLALINAMKGHDCSLCEPDCIHIQKATDVRNKFIGNPYPIKNINM